MKLKINISVIFISLLIIFASCDLSGIPYESENVVSRPFDESETGRVRDNALTAEEWLSTLQSENYGGYEFTIALSRQNTFVPQEEQLGKVDPVLELRNQLVQDKFNIKIVEKFANESDIRQGVANSIKAGLYYADLISISGDSIARLASEGQVFNLFSLPHFDAKAGYLNNKTLAAATGSKTAYVLYDNVSFFEDQLWGVFYNKKLLREIGINDLSDSYKNNLWTWEAFALYAETVAADVMEKRSPDKEVDLYGYGITANSEEFIKAVWISSGMKIFGDTSFVPITVNVDYKKASTVINQIKYLTTNKAYLDHGTNTEKIIEAFNKGRLAFMVGNLENAKVISESGIEWGLLPLPKLTREQDSIYSYISSNAAGIAVPLWQRNSDRTGKILNALCAASYEQIENAIKTNYLNFNLQDNTSAIMLNRIIENPAADISTIYGSFYPKLAAVSTDAVVKAVTGTETLEALINREITSFNEFLETNFK